MNLLSKFFSNTRKPEGFFGRLMVNGMNGGSHAKMAEWGLSGVDVADDANILDVGCGGGANIARLLSRAPKGHVKGIDYSPVSVAKSSKVNAKAISADRCQVIEGSAAALPFKVGEFDLVTAFETVYFWPDIVNCFVGVHRVLKEGGRFVITNESDGSSANDAKWESMIEGMHTYKPAELQSILEKAGFSDIAIRINNQKHWLSVIAKK